MMKVRGGHHGMSVSKQTKQRLAEAPQPVKPRRSSESQGQKVLLQSSKFWSRNFYECLKNFKKALRKALLCPTILIFLNRKCANSTFFVV